MEEINIILPNQLFKTPSLKKENKTYLIEEYLFFRQYNFHKQKIHFHRATMKNYEKHLSSIGFRVTYIDAFDNNADIRTFIETQVDEKCILHCYHPEDNWLQKRIEESCVKKGIKLVRVDNPLFLANQQELNVFFKKEKKKFFQTSFYKTQRQKFNLLLNEDGKPEGGKWTYDDQNREKYPKDRIPPAIQHPKKNTEFKNASIYVENHFKTNFGILNEEKRYPTSHEEAEAWLNQFLAIRFKEFGPYEDAVVKEFSVLHHSLLSPLINCGLLNPLNVIQHSMKYYREKNIPINSCEGFIRQIIGWREFIRGVYVAKGSQERTTNFWGFSRKIPNSFYEGNTGIEPVDDTIHKIKVSSYANHIERLMIIGNFMLLCEFDPDEVYKWFMEVFIDSYDWVMVPNVYGMSQFADGGLMSTKPYISSSNYILKMSNYKKGEWCKVWDALFWNFMDKQRSFFLKNPRMRMLISSFDKMDNTKRENFLITADNYLNRL